MGMNRDMKDIEIDDPTLDEQGRCKCCVCAGKRKQTEKQKAPVSAILRERVEFWLQELRCGAWRDYACKDAPEICLQRKVELATEKPERIFRCIIRVISDHELLPNQQ